MNSQALRLSPSNSPFFKTSTPKSPTKVKNEEPGLRLKKVIGTTTASANGFDCLPSQRQFAYTAGAAAVVSTVDTDLKVTQRFYRARPNLASGLRDALGPISPTPYDPRNRVLGSLREQAGTGSPLGASMRDWSDSPTGKSATAKDRVKAATSVALSPNGKWIAVGETGYKPRVLIFSNRSDSNESPVCGLSEHTFGVHALSFSPDSRYLASLGTVNDGFLYIWIVDDRTGAATLHSSNKCTSTINCMTWVGMSVLTAGLRFVKLWRPDDETLVDSRNLEASSTVLTPIRKGSDFGNSILSPKLRVLPGKNIILSELLEANFVTAIPFDGNKAILCSESGDICLLDDSDKAQIFSLMAITNFRITAARLNGRGELHVTGPGSQSKRVNLEELQKRNPASVKRERRTTMSPSKVLMSFDTATTTAMATIGDITVELDSRRGIRLTRAGDYFDENTEVASHQIAAHNDAVLGVQCLRNDSLPAAAYLTFAGNGSVQLWDIEGSSVAGLQIPVQSSPDMYDLTNELRAVSHLQTDTLLAAGDKYGTLSLLDVSTGTVVTSVRAHSTEVVDILTFERAGVQLVVTASRDRMVQLFAWSAGKLELLQTMDEHAAAVSNLATASNGDFLLSSSADRTVVVREAMLRAEDDPTSVAFVILRTITLKSSPTSMCIGSDADEIYVSTVDRSIGKYSIKNGQAGFSFKCSDTDGGEAAAMSKILYTPSLNGNPTIIGVSSADKSVRLYSEYGSLIARDWGHTEGITDVALLENGRGKNSEQDYRAQLVTVAADSTIFMWDTVSQTSAPKEPVLDLNGVVESPIANKLTPMAPPLRKVLSHSELSRFTREKSIDEGEVTSPPAIATPTQVPSSPHRLKKKSSRTSVAQPPRLEPAFRSNFADSSGRKSLRRRSPSPPSPRSKKKDVSRKPSLGMSLRSKSSEVLNTYAATSTTTASTNNTTGFGSVTSSTESVCRTLRAYRKKLVTSSTSDKIAPDTLRELEKELKLTARVVGEKSQGKNLDEAMMAKLLNQASDSIVNRLDERIKEMVDDEMRRSREGSPKNGIIVESPVEVDGQSREMDTVTGALEKVVLESR